MPRDQDVLAALRGLVRFDDAPHAPEHALEVELPFLQVLTGSITVVPLLGGQDYVSGGSGRPEAAMGWAGDCNRGQLRSVPFS